MLEVLVSVECLLILGPIKIYSKTIPSAEYYLKHLKIPKILERAWYFSKCHTAYCCKLCGARPGLVKENASSLYFVMQFTKLFKGDKWYWSIQKTPKSAYQKCSSLTRLLGWDFLWWYLKNVLLLNWFYQLLLLLCFTICVFNWVF